jgi:hypothetical protein
MSTHSLLTRSQRSTRWSHNLLTLISVNIWRFSPNDVRRTSKRDKKTPVTIVLSYLFLSVSRSIWIRLFSVITIISYKNTSVTSWDFHRISSAFPILKNKWSHEVGCFSRISLGRSVTSAWWHCIQFRKILTNEHRPITEWPSVDCFKFRNMILSPLWSVKRKSGVTILKVLILEGHGHVVPCENEPAIRRLSLSRKTDFRSHVRHGKSRQKSCSWFSSN